MCWQRSTAHQLSPAAPLLGQHSHEALREIGYDDARIEALVGEGIIAEPQRT